MRSYLVTLLFPYIGIGISSLIIKGDNLLDALQKYKKSTEIKNMTILYSKELSEDELIQFPDSFYL